MPTTVRPGAINPPSPTRFRLTTLGRVGLRIEGRDVDLLRPGVPLGVLTYLTTLPQRLATREHLADMFWPASDQAHARQALRKNLSRLRDVLGRDAFDDRGQGVRLLASVVTDREEFLQSVERNDLATAVSIYSGLFFPEPGNIRTADFEHWVDIERDRVRNIFLRVGERLVREALDRATPRGSLPLARRLREEAPDSESVFRLWLEVLMAMHSADEARQDAEAFLKQLGTDGRSAELATQRLVQKIIQAPYLDARSEDEGIWIPELSGRGPEFETIIKNWREVTQISARHVHLEGQPGFGMSRLLDEAAKRIRAIGGKTVRVAADASEKDLGSSFVADLAGELARFPGGAGVSENTAAILVGLNPVLSNLFRSANPSIGHQDLLQQRVFALADLIASIAEQSPIALLLDDAQWIDAESRQILRGAIARIKNAAVLVVSTGRPTGTGSIFPNARRVLLPPIAPQDVVAILLSLAAFEDEAVGRRIAAALHQTCRGSPKLLMETIQLAVKAGHLNRHLGTWRIQDLEGLMNWLGERNVLEDRLRSLTPQARKFLLTLAVAGTPLGRTDVERAVQSGIVSPDTLTELERRGYISPRGGRWDLAHDEIGHTLIRLAAETERRAIHATRGRNLIALGIEDRSAAMRAARHLAEGKSYHELGHFFRNWVAAVRHTGNKSSSAELARELLGDLATPELVRRVILALPARERFPKQLLVSTLIAIVILIIVVLLYRLL